MPPEAIVIADLHEVFVFLGKLSVPANESSRIQAEYSSYWEREITAKITIGCVRPDTMAEEFAKQLIDGHLATYDCVIASLGSPPSWFPDYLMEYGYEHPVGYLAQWLQVYLRKLARALIYGFPPGVERLLDIVRAGGIPIGVEGDPRTEWPDGTIVAAWIYDEPPRTS